MKKYLVVIIFLQAALSFGQQSSKIDSLKNLINASVADTSMVSLKIEVAKAYGEKNQDSAFHYYEQAISQAKEFGSLKKEVTAIYSLAKFYNEIHQYENAIINFRLAEEAYTTLFDFDGLGYSQNYIGYCYTSLYAEEKALESFLKSIKSFQQTGNIDGIGMNYIDIGNLYYGQENYDFAKKYFNDALAIYNELNDKLGVETCYINLGNATADGGDCKAGLEFYEKAMEIALELDDTYGVAVNYNNIGDCYITLKDYNKAEDYFLKAKELAKELEDHELDAIIWLNLADVKSKTKNYKLAIQYANLSIDLVNKYGLTEYLTDNLDIITQCYEELGDDKNALIYHRLFKVQRDSIIKTDKEKKVQLFQALNNLEKNEFTIKELSAQNEIAEIKYENEKKVTFFLIIGLLLFAIMILFMIVQQTAKKKAYNLLKFKSHQINKMNDEIEKQRDHLKTLNDTKDQFFSIIAHDLKNPFNSINGFTELMIENNQLYDDQKRLKFLKIIKDSTGKVSGLLDNLLIWANNQSGNLEFRPEPLILDVLVADSLSILEAQAMNKDIKLDTNIEKEVEIYADKNMLDTVLRNIVSNAIKFTEKGGEIKIQGKQANEVTTILVRDNGVGISKADLDVLFDMNKKKSSQGTQNEQGSGLGLILCKEFIERHGGELTMESELGVGSTVSFTIPG